MTESTQDRDKDFLEFLVKSIVDNPDDVEVERKIDEMGVLLTLKVKREDMGQVIGRKGATANAIRSLLRVVGMKNNAHVNLKILEPEGEESIPSATTSNEAPAAVSEDSSDVDKAVEDLKKDL